MPRRVFLLSPARSDGVRARLCLRPAATFDLAVRLRSPEGATLGEAYAFMSGLYFRGKLAYARAFARPPAGAPGVLVIAPGRGLLDAETRVRADDLRALGRVPVDAADPRYRVPLEAAARALAGALGRRDEAVLLGSVATSKYVETLADALGARLRFPRAFVGRGDLSRGGLMLRCVRAGTELEYARVDGAPRRGPRPARLAALAVTSRAPRT